jgi:hypothetical protein
MFNTMANEVMINPRGLGDDSTIFVAGNDDSARSAWSPTVQHQTRPVMTPKIKTA